MGGTTRSAEEADLIEDHGDQSTTYPKTDNNPAMNNPSPTPVPPAQEQELDALTYIPVPPIDQLCVQGWDSHSTFKNLNLAQKSIWDSKKAAKLLAYKAYRGRIEGCEEIAALHELIKNTLETTKVPIIAAPIPEIVKGRRDAAPVCTLIKGITPGEAETLINKVKPQTLPKKTDDTN